RETPVLRVNHALRGVVAPAGRARLVLSYEPASFRWGLRAAAAALLLLASLRCQAHFSRRRRPSPVAGGPPRALAARRGKGSHC
ncbi:MAG: hypothetical protein MUE73_20530, partial [Planctomycetes bacterium]|nr:hypothetical protein [Planctomycetota bacterium]